MNKRISWNRFKGKLPENAVRVDRATRYGNPFTLQEFNRADALKLYAIYLDYAIKHRLLDLTPLLKKDLACSCSLSENCHADILLTKITEMYK